MAQITIFGQGNMGQAIASRFEKAGNTVNFITKDQEAASFGEIVVLAVPYGAIEGILSTYASQLAGKIIIDISNPVNFDTFDDLVVPADSSAAALIQEKLPTSFVVKGFNTTFGASLATGKVADQAMTTLLLASDHADAKAKIEEVLSGSDLRVKDAGSLKRARELEAMGFLQISLAAREQVSWTGGFAVLD